MLTMKLYMPLTADLWGTSEWGDRENDPVKLRAEDLVDYEDSIAQKMLQERMPEEAERGIMHWYGKNDAVNRKVGAARFGVEARQGKLWGIVECEVTEPLNAAEMEKLEEYLSGQASDGWGEGFEQREIKTGEGILNVHLWQDHGWKLRMEQEVFAPGAIAPMQAKEPMQFEVKVIGKNSGANGGILVLPASDVEILDRLDRARENSTKDCEIEIIDSRHWGIASEMEAGADLTALNYMAKKLNQFSDQEIAGLEGRVERERIAKGQGAMPIEEICNLAANLKFEKLLPKVKTDEALGKFYVENNRVPELVGVQAAVLGWLDYAAVGRQYREQEQGVFTHNGYSVATYEPEGEHSRVVIPALEKPGYVFRLTVDAEYLYDDTSKPVALNLPATMEEINGVLHTLGKTSMASCAWVQFESILPQIDECITSDVENFWELNELAGLIHAMQAEGRLPTYKAMLSVAPQDFSLSEAVTLAYQVNDFLLDRSIKDKEEYGMQALKNAGVSHPELLRGVAEYAEQIMQEEFAFQTPYGALVSLEDQTLEQAMGRQQPGMRME